MKGILIAGGSGLIGQRMISMLHSKGIPVGILSRSASQLDNAEVIQWDLDQSEIYGDITKYAHIVNLTGAGIADKPWTSKRKKIIIDSRVKSAELLSKTLSSQNHRPQSIINASAIGYYGDSGDVVLTEDMPIQNREFLSEVSEIWEDSAAPLREITDRLIMLRIGVVLSNKGGALDKMVPPIRLGMANYLGSGKQWMSWAHIDDICSMILHFIENKNISGVYNGVSPNPKTNREFTKVLKSVINKYALMMPAPAFAIKTIFGELSSLVLNSNRVSAQKLLDSGFEFQYPELKSALTDLFAK